MIDEEYYNHGSAIIFTGSHDAIPILRTFYPSDTAWISPISIAYHFNKSNRNKKTM